MLKNAGSHQTSMHTPGMPMDVIGDKTGSGYMMTPPSPSPLLHSFANSGSGSIVDDCGKLRSASRGLLSSRRRLRSETALLDM